MATSNFPALQDFTSNQSKQASICLARKQEITVISAFKGKLCCIKDAWYHFAAL